MHDFFGWVGFQKKNIRLDFGTDTYGTGLDQESFFPLFHFIERVLSIEYELKELQSNVCDIFWRDRPSDNELVEV